MQFNQAHPIQDKFTVGFFFHIIGKVDKAITNTSHLEIEE